MYLGLHIYYKMIHGPCNIKYVCIHVCMHVYVRLYLHATKLSIQLRRGPTRILPF